MEGAALATIIGQMASGTKTFRVMLFFTWINFMQPITSTFFTSIGKAIKGVFLSMTRQILFLLLFSKLYGASLVTLFSPIF